MAYDFRADQVRTSRIISSGSRPILVYPSSSALNFQGDLRPSFSTASLGPDVFFFVSGSDGGRNTSGVTVLGGDTVVSGTIYGGYVADFGANVLRFGADAALISSESDPTQGIYFFFESGAEIAGADGMARTTFKAGAGQGLNGHGGLLVVSGGRASDGASVVSGYGGNVEIVAGQGARNGSTFVDRGGDVILLPGTGSLNGSVYIGTTRTGSVNYANFVLVGTGSLGANSDAFMFVSGSATKKAVFGGDVVVSGALTGSIRTINGTNLFITGSGIGTNYNSLGQWEISSSIQRINIASYNRTNLTSPTVIGYAYINPSDYHSGATLRIEAVGMNMNGVSGGLALYNQNDATTDASLTWSGAGTLTTGSYQSATMTIPASAKSYEIHLSQSGDVSGGSNYTSVGFVNFRIS